MKKITEITKRDIVDIFSSGITMQEQKIKYDFMEREILYEEPYDIKMFFWGRLDEITFLKRLYKLDEMPSHDSRYNDAYGDIWQHTVNNDDWDIDWVFQDNRFCLFNGEDKYLLDFLCEIFHPAVRDEKKPWIEFLKIIKGLLLFDGYEFYEKAHVSGRSIYGWRLIQSSDKILIAQIENIKEAFNTDYVRMQVELMHDMINTAPHSAIGKAKELLEICCKTILDEQKIQYSNELDLMQLMRMTCDSIDLSPKKIPNNVEGKDIAGRILGNLANISQGMAELRNIYGDGHGKNKDFKPLNPRYANLAVGASVSAVNFMWETYLDRIKREN